MTKRLLSDILKRVARKKENWIWSNGKQSRPWSPQLALERFDLQSGANVESARADIAPRRSPIVLYDVSNPWKCGAGTDRIHTIYLDVGQWRRYVYIDTCRRRITDPLYIPQPSVYSYKYQTDGARWSKIHTSVQNRWITYRSSRIPNFICVLDWFRRGQRWLEAFLVLKYGDGLNQKDLAW